MARIGWLAAVILIAAGCQAATETVDGEAADRAGDDRGATDLARTVDLARADAAGADLAQIEAADLASSPPDLATVGVNHYYVATGGSDANDGSAAHPWRTITHADQALALGAHGTIVHVAAGTYSDSIKTRTAGSATQPVRFLSDLHWGAKITAFWSVQGAYQEVVGFEMTAPSLGGIIACYVGGGNGTAHHCRILGNYVHDVGTSQCASAGAINTSVVASGKEPATDDARGYNVVAGNVIRHVGADAGAPNHCNQFHGVYLSGPHDIAENNLISGVIGWGIHARGDVAAQVISNNTLFNNSHGGIVLDETGPTYPVDDYVTVTNNLVVNNGLQGASPAFGIDFYNAQFGTHNLFSNNLLYGNLPSNWGKGNSGNTNCADPCDDPHMQSGSDGSVFASFQSDWNNAPAAKYDPANYALRANSPAIDHGTSSCAPGMAPCAASIDLLGGPRPAGATWDIGAYEAGAAAPAWPWM